MSNFKDVLDEDRRLAILRLLEQLGGQGNESVIQSACHALGHKRGVTREVIRGDLTWLKERDLLQIEMFDDKVMVAAITRRGVDVANGDFEIRGVKRPAIGM